MSGGGAGGERPELPPDVEALEGVSEAVAERDEGRLRRATAFGIVLVSILAAIMAWRAAVADEKADTTRVHAQQNRLAQQELASSDETAVLNDIQTYGRYGEHADLARELDRAARGTKPSAARSLLVRAQDERNAAASQLPLFGPTRPTIRRDGSAGFDAAYARQQQHQLDTDLLNLRSPDELERQSATEHQRGVRLTGLAALFVAALVLLTFAELSRGALTRIFASGGVVVAAAALVLFAFV